jgi:hypothetical protein
VEQSARHINREGENLVKKKSDASTAVRQVEKSIREIRARSKQLLKRAELNVREYRREVATLKKQGIVSQRIQARSHQPTRYMINKLKKFKAVATGRELAVPIDKLSPHRAREYTEKGIASQIEKFLVIPKTAVRQRADVFKGHIRTTTELRRGQEEVIKFPSRLEDMHDILNWLADNERVVNELKGPRGQLGFQLGGHNSRDGLANVRELIRYLQKYNGTEPRYRGNIFNGHSKEIAREFVLIRFRPAKGHKPTMDPYYGTKRFSKGHRKDRKDERRGEEYRREKERKRKARQRLAESQEAHNERLDKQRERDRAQANTRREKRMSKKLMGD